MSKVLSLDLKFTAKEFVIFRLNLFYILYNLYNKHSTISSINVDLWNDNRFDV